MRKVQKVIGIAWRSPPIRRMSCVSLVPWISAGGAKEQRPGKALGQQMEHRR